MIDQLVHKAHHAIKKVPFLRAFDRWAVNFWFSSSFVRFVFEINLLLRLTALALRHRRRLIVLGRFGGIGDIVCSIPAVREFIRANPDSQVVYVTRLAYGDLIARANLGIPCVTSAMHVLPPKWATWMIKKCLYLTYQEELAEHPEETPRSLTQEFGKYLGFEQLNEDPVLDVNADRVAEIRARYRKNGKERIVLLHTGPTWKVKEWPFDRWQQLVAALNEDPRLQILQIVADRNTTVLHARCELIPGAIPIECSDNLGELIDTVAAADLLIGIDSGPIHIAAAVGTDCVALFGPTNPAFLLPPSSPIKTVWQKIDCSFCHHRRPRPHWQTGCPHDIACMSAITPEKVLDQISLFSPLRRVAASER